MLIYQNIYQNKDYNLNSVQYFVNDLFTGDTNNEDGYDSKKDDAVLITKFGMTFSLSLTYNF